MDENNLKFEIINKPQVNILYNVDLNVVYHLKCGVNTNMLIWNWLTRDSQANYSKKNVLKNKLVIYTAMNI